MKIDTKKFLFAVLLGTVMITWDYLLLNLVLDTRGLMDHIDVRGLLLPLAINAQSWMIFPVIIGVYYLSTSSYLNYANRNAYLKSGARYGFILAIIAILFNLISSIVPHLNERNMGFLLGRWALYSLITISLYTLLGAVFHYLFNVNVDASKEDKYKQKYFVRALILGIFFIFVGQALRSFYSVPVRSDMLEYFPPTIVMVMAVVRWHQIKYVNYPYAIRLGALSGLMLGLMLDLLFLIYFFVRINVEFVSVNRNLPIQLQSADEVSQFIYATALTVIFLPLLFAVIGALTGLIMKLLRKYVG